MGNFKPDIDLLQNRLSAVALPEDLKLRLQRMLDRLKAVDNAGGQTLEELENISKYIGWATLIPFGVYSEDNLDLQHAKQMLDSGHYGLQAVKENILEFIASQNLLKTRRLLNSSTGGPGANSGANSGAIAPTSAMPVPQIVPTHLNTNVRSGTPILCFVGVQGIGKTTMAKSIANTMGRGFQRIALGAFANVNELRGASRTDAGAEPGQITKALMRSRSMNPVILLDEIDKVSDSTGLRVDIMAALLEVLDPEQNKEFVDRYLDYPLDLSQVLFITTANNLGSISAALLDRLEIIRFSSYTDEEKQHIARDYLLPKVRAISGIQPQQLEFADTVWTLLIRPLGFDPGIRQLERNLLQLCRKVAKLIVEGQATKIVLTPQNFRQFFPEEIAVFS